MFRAIPLLAPLALVLAVSTASAQPPAVWRDFYEPPHMVMKDNFESWRVGQQLRAGFYEYELGDGRYPGRVYYLPPGRGMIPWRVTDRAGQIVPDREILRAHTYDTVVVTPNPPLWQVPVLETTPASPPVLRTGGYELRSRR